MSGVNISPTSSAGADERLHIAVTQRLGTFELECDIDLPLAGLTVLFGASGAGKSTLINLVCGLHRPDRGRISVGATVFSDRGRGIELPVPARGLGVVFQDAKLFPHLTAKQNLLFGWKRAGARAVAARATFDAVVELLGLAPLLARRPHTLSGGEKQRVAIGRALLAQPRLLLMDEPLAALDAPRKAEVLPYIERLRDEFNVPILYVSHVLDEVLRLATSLVLLDSGRVLAAGSVTDVLAEPAVQAMLGGHEIGALVFGTVATHDDEFALSTLACDGFSLRVPRVALPLGTKLRLRIPAREVALALAPVANVSITNQIAGVIESVMVPNAQGPHAQVQVRVAAGTLLTALVTRQSLQRLGLTPGALCCCLVKSVTLDAGALALARGRAAATGTGQ